GPETAFLRL
uniref:Extended FMRFamide-3 n=1 Tax=Praedatophasma maraisi TaxID=409170 RepID=FAR3_PRAMA|nr:RecName: Full=Extended FMRFamide-3; Short=FMRFa-3 [Praedatophasma maraisi]